MSESHEVAPAHGSMASATEGKTTTVGKGTLLGVSSMKVVRACVLSVAPLCKIYVPHSRLEVTTTVMTLCEHRRWWLWVAALAAVRRVGVLACGQR